MGDVRGSMGGFTYSIWVLFIYSNLDAPILFLPARSSKIKVVQHVSYKKNINKKAGFFRPPLFSLRVFGWNCLELPFSVCNLLVAGPLLSPRRGGRDHGFLRGTLQWPLFLHDLGPSPPGADLILHQKSSKIKVNNIVNLFLLLDLI